jgi:sphingomyelin phosphodiesterase acid-like 3
MPDGRLNASRAGPPSPPDGFARASLDESSACGRRPTRPFRCDFIKSVGFGPRARFVLACALLLATCSALPSTARADDPWLFVNDVHYKPSSDSEPSPMGTDTNAALLTSALAEMQRVAPHPPVVVMAGDFLGHGVLPNEATSTMATLAHQFGAAFPQAQFVIALGNEDSDCGDFGASMNSPFLHAVAAAWEPLVNRDGAAPNFLRTFGYDGFYTARLPVHGLRAIVINNTFWSPFYRPWCGHDGDATVRSFAELETALGSGGAQRRWLVMHIPPGIDAGTTAQLAHDLAIVPFLRAGPLRRFLALAGDPSRGVAAVITGHAHRFGYRIIDAYGRTPIPVLVAPALSPIYGSLPAFLTAHVGSDGTLRGVEEHSLVSGQWRDLGGWEALGAPDLSGASLVRLQRRLEDDLAARTAFATLYAGPIRWNEINTQNWPAYTCATTELDMRSFRACTDAGGFGWLTSRGVTVTVVAVAACAALVCLACRARRQVR